MKLGNTDSRRLVWDVDRWLQELENTTIATLSVEIMFIVRVIFVANVEALAPATGSATPHQGKGFSSGFTARLGAGSGLPSRALFALPNDPAPRTFLS